MKRRIKKKKEMGVDTKCQSSFFLLLPFQKRSREQQRIHVFYFSLYKRKNLKKKNNYSVE